jgi:plastocyanin
MRRTAAATAEAGGSGPGAARRSGARRAAAAVACALGLTAVALLSGGGWPAHGSTAAAAECTWNRHARKVVKHVRRHGRMRRVVRSHVRWSCEPVPAAPIVSPPPPALPAPIPPPPEPEANRVGVTANDSGGAFGFVLSRPQVRSGQVTVELNNQGEDPHNLNLRRQSSEAEPVFQLANALPAHQQVASFELPAGTYRLWCSLPEHDEKGMHTTLVVE